MDSSKPLESLDLDELTDWLMEKDIPYESCKILAGKLIQYVDYIACLVAKKLKTYIR